MKLLHHNKSVFVSDWQSTASSAPVISLMFYAATDIQGSLQAHVEEKNRLSSVTGTSEELGNFKITFGKPTAGEGAIGKYARYLTFIADFKIL